MFVRNQRSTGRRVLLGAAAAASVLLLGACGDSAPPALSLHGGESDADEIRFDTLETLVGQSAGVLRGRFRPDPVVVDRNVEEEADISEATYVWEFDVDKALLNRYPKDSEVYAQIEKGGPIKVALLARDMDEQRGGKSFEEFHESRPSRYNFNSYPTDSDVVIFTYPAGFPPDVLKKDSSLASAQVVAGGYACVDAKSLAGPCLYAADQPGGSEIGRIAADELPKFSAGELEARLAAAPPEAVEPAGEG